MFCQFNTIKYELLPFSFGLNFALNFSLKYLEALMTNTIFGKAFGLVLFSIIVSNESGAQEIDGNWVEATRGCNLQLQENELAKIASGEVNTYFGNTQFQLNHGAFEVVLSNGDGCAELSINKDLIFKSGDVLRCGPESKNIGVYSHVQKNDFIFQATINGGHYFGSSVKKLKIEIQHSVLKVSYRNRTCKNMVQYFIVKQILPLTS
jgi:hypothetical protein